MIIKKGLWGDIDVTDKLNKIKNRSYILVKGPMFPNTEETKKQLIVEYEDVTDVINEGDIFFFRRDVVLDSIEMNVSVFKTDEIRKAIETNDPIEENLHVITVLSNPAQFKRRYELAIQFINRMNSEKNVILYVVELTYGNQHHKVTDSTNPRHLQLRCDIPLWHKENLINIGVRKLLPPDWKAMAWIDADIEFEDPHWAINTLKVLNGTRDIVQLFSILNDMRKKYEEGMSISRSRFSKLEISNQEDGVNGFAWACSRKAYDQLGGLYDYAIIGGADSIISHLDTQIKNNKYSDNMFETITNYNNRSIGLKMGYIPGTIYHYFHGDRMTRMYDIRHNILKNNNYSPLEHLYYREDGLLIPTETCPQKLLELINSYFFSRNDDA